MIIDQAIWELVSFMDVPSVAIKNDNDDDKDKDDDEECIRGRHQLMGQS